MVPLRVMLKGYVNCNGIGTPFRKKVTYTVGAQSTYTAFVSKLSKLSGEYICPQKTQKAAVFFIQKIFGWRVNSNFNRCKITLKIIA
jgi:hypothetical protein